MDILELLSDQNNSTTEITNRITEALMSSAEKTLGYRNPTPLKSKNSDKECRTKKQTYNRAMKVLKYNKTPEAVRLKRKACSEYKAAVRKHTRAKNKRFQNRLRDMRTNDSRAYWRMLNTKTRDKIGPTIDELKEHFVKLNEAAIGNDDDIEENLNANEHDYSDAILNDAISEEEVLKASTKLRNNKSPGEDEVLNEFIKASMPHMVKQYVGLFNKILDTSTYPEAWALGLIIPIYKKKGDKKDCNNYRGITLLSCLGKLFTTVLNERLKQYCDINKIIKENQTGFLANYSTTDHIFSLKSLIDIFFKNKQKLFCAFVDYQKAFDTVWRKGLLYKLDKSGIFRTSKVFKIVAKMYEGVKSRVFTGNIKSEYFASNAGVRQGENLSPLLFSLYINDLEEYLLANGNNFIDFKDEICNSYVKLLVLLYADDTIVLSNTAAGLQKALEDLYNYCTKWKLQVNSSKTKVIIFSKRKPKTPPVFTYNNEVLENVFDFKYLGVYFKSNANFSKCKMHIKETASKAMFALLSKGRVLQLPVDIMLEMFNKTVLPIMLYGCEVWGFSNNDMLDTVFLKFCKYLLGLKSCTPNCMIYGELGCYPVSVTIQIRIISY